MVLCYWDGSHFHYSSAWLNGVMDFDSSTSITVYDVTAQSVSCAESDESFVLNLNVWKNIIVPLKWALVKTDSKSPT